MKWIAAATAPRRHSARPRPRSCAAAPRPAILAVALLSTLGLSGLTGVDPAAAETAFGVRAGTPGVGIELTTGLTSTLHLRLAATAWDQDVTVETDAVRYDGDVELRNALALLDVHPGGGGFRLTVGAALNDNGLVATAPLLDLAAGELPPGLPPDLDLGRLVGRAEVDAVAPYAGIGFGNPLGGDGGWSFACDLGAIYLGSPDVTLDLETPLPIELVPGAEDVIESFLEAEEAALEDEIGDYDLFPVLSFSLSYRF